MYIEIVFLIIGYIFGSIPVGYLIGKYGHNINVKEHGSGNIGMANVLRLCGKKAGIATMILDMIKGALPILAGRLFVWFGDYAGFGTLFSTELTDIGLFLSLIGLLAIIGHSHPIWLKFKGGKSASVGAGVLLGINPLAFFFVMICWVVLLKITRYTSLSNILVGLLYAPMFWLFAGNDPFYNKSWWGGGIGLVSFLFATWRHKDNIKRLIAGEERKIGEKEKTN